MLCENNVHTKSNEKNTLLLCWKCKNSYITPYLSLSLSFLTLYFPFFSFILSLSVYFYYKELKYNWHRALFNRSCINNDRWRQQQRNCNTQIPEASMQRKQTFIRLIRSFICSLARTCSTCSNNRWRRDFLRSVSGDLGQSDRRYTNWTMVRSRCRTVFYPPSDFLRRPRSRLVYGAWSSWDVAIDVTPDDCNRHLSIIRLIHLRNNEIRRTTRPFDFLTIYVPRKIFVRCT